MALCGLFGLESTRVEAVGVGPQVGAAVDHPGRDRQIGARRDPVATDNAVAHRFSGKIRRGRVEPGHLLHHHGRVGQRRDLGGGRRPRQDLVGFVADPGLGLLVAAEQPQREGQDRGGGVVTGEQEQLDLVADLGVGQGVVTVTAAGDEQRSQEASLPPPWRVLAGEQAVAEHLANRPVHHAVLAVVRAGCGVEDLRRAVGMIDGEDLPAQGDRAEAVADPRIRDKRRQREVSASGAGPARRRWRRTCRVHRGRVGWPPSTGSGRGGRYHRAAGSFGGRRSVGGCPWRRS